MRAIPIAAIMIVAVFLLDNPAYADGTWCAQYGTGFSGNGVKSCRYGLPINRIGGQGVKLRRVPLKMAGNLVIATGPHLAPLCREVLIDKRPECVGRAFDP